MRTESPTARARRLKADRNRKASRRAGAKPPVERMACAYCGVEFDRLDARRIYCSTLCRGRRSPEFMEAARSHQRGRYREAAAWLEEYKTSRGCADCGFDAHFAALQFDHEGPKTAAISELRWSISRMLAEIENGKCVIRCANCHSVKTWERLQPKE